MAIYDVTDHALLTGAAKMLSPAELDTQSTLAEALLGLDEAQEYTADPQYSRALMAVALQVSFQAERGVEGAVATSMTEGSRSITYREALVHPMAASIAASLTAETSDEDYTTVLSVRGVGTPPRTDFPAGS